MPDLAQAERLAELVETALETPPQERAAFLQKACAGDEALQAQAETLLRGQDRMGGFLETPAFALDGAVLAEGPDGLEPGGIWSEGTQVGDCVIGPLLGEGGMGEVYLAEDRHLGRRVALKVVRGGGRGGRLLRHFRHEQRILAALNHPNIARLYGGGTAPDGAPYFVMEFVEGERLDTFCREGELSVEARLALFRKICTAVAYAHQNLVVHRDLKPANIRVTPDGEPKLLDFGIAKLLDPDDDGTEEATVHTLPGAMTPFYASPEQIKGEPITTASDVYSLGVVLYELLCGQRPFAHLKGRRPDELARAICEEEPPRPSTVAGRTGTAPATIPATPLRRQLTGDLDNILARALRKEPARRYPSVLAFSEDLRRHGEGLPVAAHRDTFPYRAGKFVRRHRTGVAAALLGTLALVGGLIATAWQAHVARRAQADAEVARRQAERVGEFFRKLLASASPGKLGRDVKVVEALDAAGKTIDQELAAEPEVLAQVHLTLCQTYSEMTLYEPSIRHGRIALDSLRRLRGDDDALTMRAMVQLGSVLTNTAHMAEAEPLLRQALAWHERQATPDPAAKAGVLKRLIYVLVGSNQIREAEARIAEARPLLLASAGENSLSYVEFINITGSVKRMEGDFAGAAAVFREAVTLCDRIAPGDSRSTPALLNLCIMLFALGDDAGLKPALARLTEDARRGYGEESAFYQSALLMAALRDFAAGNYPQVVPVIQQLLASMGSSYPDDSLNPVQVRAVLGASLVRIGRAAEGEPLLRKAYEHGQKLDKVEFAHTVGNLETVLGECLLVQGRYAEAEPLLLAGHDDLERRLGAQNRLTLYSQGLLRTLYTVWGRPDEAARHP